MTTVASAKAPELDDTVAVGASPPSPCTAIRIGSVSTVSLRDGDRRAAFSNAEYAWAATRSTGLPARPSAGVVAADGLDHDARRGA